ncbi:hypothetical protein [uncultured Duncaniella sp.]|uniref:hypothetical protein n=1 Tax=uncultured Duncaniella sp. TaxID=2768039 RepID=UPI0025A51A4F|nr:hypothetical protein [uncultured Duncaniella sp.]
MMPPKSEYYSVVKFAWDACVRCGNWEDAWKACEEKYKRYNWIHTYPNAAAEVVSLYFGRNDFDEHGFYDDFEPPTYGRYSGSYAQDEMGYSDDDIDTIFDGDPSAYWNID